MKLLMPHLKICGGFSFFRCWLQAFFYVCCGCCRGLAFRKCLIRCLLGLSWPALDFTSQFRSKCCLCRVWKNEAHFQLVLPLQIQHPTLDMVDFLSKSLHYWMLNVLNVHCWMLLQKDELTWVYFLFPSVDIFSSCLSVLFTFNVYSFSPFSLYRPKYILSCLFGLSFLHNFSLISIAL